MPQRPARPRRWSALRSPVRSSPTGVLPPLWRVTETIRKWRKRGAADLQGPLEPPA